MARKIRDERDWLYQGLHGSLSTRRLRVWRVGEGRLVAVVTQGPGDSGTSISNAAEEIHAQLHAEYPGERIEIVEHWIDPQTFGGGRHYDTVTVPDHGGLPRWSRMSVAGLRALLGPTLDDDADEDKDAEDEDAEDEDEDTGGASGAAARPAPRPGSGLVDEQVGLGGGWSLHRVEPDDPRIDPRFQVRGEE